MNAILEGLSIERKFDAAYDAPVILYFTGMSISPPLPRKFLTVLNESGSPVSGATVKIVDNSGITILSTTTDSNGLAYSVLDQYVDNPIIMTVEKSGYNVYSAVITVNNVPCWVITMFSGGGGRQPRLRRHNV